jgi:hypothetical protein
MQPSPVVDTEPDLVAARPLSINSAGVSLLGAQRRAV